MGRHEILIVDDKKENVQLLQKFIEEAGHLVRTALDGETALLSVSAKPPDLILLDIRMPGIDGVEVCRRLQREERTARIPVIFISALEDTRIKMEAFQAGGVDYITKPFSHEEVIARVSTHLQLNDYRHNLERKVEESVARIRALNTELELTQSEIVVALGTLLEERCRETGYHVVRVAEYSRLLAELRGLDEETCYLIHRAAPLHDAGKVAIPDYILHKEGSLDPEEWEIMKTHAIRGYEIFRNSTRPMLKMVAVIAKEHHENWDGSGYPEGLAGEEISMAGRIVHLADVFDALGNRRCYKKAWDIEKVFRYIRENEGIMFDPVLVRLLLQNRERFLDIMERYCDDSRQNR